MSEQQTFLPEESAFVQDALVHLGSPEGESRSPMLASSPLLAALRSAGTSHVYADSADVREIDELVKLDGGAVVAEIDGNTANQPLVRKVTERYLEADAEGWGQVLRRRQPGLGDGALVTLLYAVICGRVGNDVVRAFAGSRDWEVSLQLHMDLSTRPEMARRVGESLRRMVPTALVKVPFAPHDPSCLLVARDLEREGIPVNLTSTFSARQVLVAALLADVSRTNIFMGRLDQGLGADLLGAHVDLEAQRALTEVRHRHGVKTRLIVASMREWRTFAQVAGCDVFTAPVDVIRGFLQQDEIGPDAIESQLETSYEGRLGVSDEALDVLGTEGVARLYEVEDEFVEFLVELRSSSEFEELDDGERLYRLFDEAGFGDIFHSPDDGEWKEIRRGKVPDLSAAVTAKLPIDTLYTLLAHADFEKHQTEIDRLIEDAARR